MPARVLPLLAALLVACGGSDFDAGEIQGGERSLETPVGVSGETQILFGDLHVHTSYSVDAFLYGLPLFGGEGVHPPADACDFARHCAGLDFFALTDHAEGLTPERWTRSLDSLRACDGRDLVAFAGYEWTQAGLTPETHFGHKNVIFPGLEPDDLPARPISALADDVMDRARYLGLARGAEALASVVSRPYADFLWWIRRLAEVPMCPGGVDTRALPADCHENAPTPEALFHKLAESGLASLVIPHGLAWGIHAPPGARLDVQLGSGRHDPSRQRLLEVFSGHGSSERYEASAAAAELAGLAGRCPAPSADFLPCCWRAGELVRERCDDPRGPACQVRVEEARRLALQAGRRPLRVLPDAPFEDWLDCDETRDAFKPAMRARPGQSAQYALALSRAGDGNDPAPQRFRFGLIGGSDNHSARAGSGYKQLARLGMSDVRGVASARLDRWLGSFVRGQQQDPQRAQPSPPEPMGFRSLLDVERGASFLYPGGLVAVHARGRTRQAIWDALRQRRVYGTSGPRILLWFDRLDDGGLRQPMGSVVATRLDPRFEVRAVGARVQQPGCPDVVQAELSSERIGALCLDECHHPGDARHPIVAIEVVRIRPQLHADEPVKDLIEDPWRRFSCAPDPAGCVVRFGDPEFAGSGRDAVYYVRALQAETPAVNGATLRAAYDRAGRAISVDPCLAGHRGDARDDCLAAVHERAWSSPIFVDRVGAPAVVSR